METIKIYDMYRRLKLNDDGFSFVIFKETSLNARELLFEFLMVKSINSSDNLSRNFTYYCNCSDLMSSA